MKPLLILKVGDALPHALARGEDFEHWVERGVGPLAVPLQVLDPRREPMLPAPGALAGAVITGSQSMVTDRAAWSEALVPWLQDMVASATPVLGICYGHQLLAHALGGEVVNHALGMEVGTVQVRKTDAAAGDPLFDGLPSVFFAQAVHRQSVQRLPAGARCLASNAHEAHHAFRVGACAWGVQFHPEFDTDAMHGYMRKFGPELAASGQAQLAGQLQPTPVAASVLGRFARFVESACQFPEPA